MRWPVLPLLLCAAAATAAPPRQPAPPVREAAPSFDVRSLEGTRYSLEDLRGRTVILHFWFANCVPCLAQLPRLERAGRDLGATGGAVLLSFALDEAGALEALPERAAFRWAVVPSAAEVARRFGVSRYPHHVVIDPSGRIATRFALAQDVDVHLAAVVRAVSESAPIPIAKVAGVTAAAFLPPTTPAADDLLARIEQRAGPATAAAIRQRLAMRAPPNHLNWTFIGQLVREQGALDDTVSAPLELLDDGWFVLHADRLDRPLIFRAFGHEPVEVDLRRALAGADAGTLTDLGRLTLKKLSPARAASLSGRLVQQEEPLGTAECRLTLPALPFHGMWGGHAGRWRAPPSEPLLVGPGGEFEVKGLPPGEVSVSCRAPGKLDLLRTFALPPGEAVDTGTLVIEEPRLLAVRYLVSDSDDFDGTPRELQLRPGTGFQPEHPKRPPDRDALLLRQQDGKLTVRLFHRPAKLYRLGGGQLEDYQGAATRRLPAELVGHEVELASGTYLLRTPERLWVLFSVRVPGPFPAPPGTSAAPPVSAIQFRVPKGCEQGRRTERGGIIQCPTVSFWWERARGEADLLEREERARFLDDGALPTEVACRVAGLDARCTLFEPEGEGPRGVVGRVAQDDGTLLVSCRIWSGNEPSAAPCSEWVKLAP